MGKAAAKLAKLSRPRLYDALPRERLFQLLDQKRKHPAIWIGGPPGAGKTTLVASYLETAKLPSVWYQVDAGDTDPATFFYYLGQVAGPTRKRPQQLQLFTSEFLTDLEGFSRRFFRTFFSRLPADTLLVFDNTQEARGSGDLDRILAEAIGQVPAGNNIILISRGAPPAVFSSCLSAQTLAVIDWSDLRITQSEAALIANARSVTDESAIERLYRQSDGWVAGLTLMLERARKERDDLESIEIKTREDVFAFFANQIFDRAPVRTRQALMRIALLPFATAPMAIELSGDPGAGRVLEEMYRRHLFTDRRGREQPRFQFHALFRKFLLERLKTHQSEEMCRSLAQKAGRLLESNGSAEDAFALYEQAGDWTAASELILSLAPTLLAQGRWKTLEHWISALPEALFSDKPWLIYWLGAARRQVDLPGARALLQPAFGLFKAAADSKGQLLVAALVVETIYYEYNDFTSLDQWIDELERLLEDVTDFPDSRSELAVYAPMLLAIMVRRPAHRMLFRCIERIERLLESPRDVNQELQAAVALLHFFSYAVEFERADHLIRRITPLVSDRNLSPLNRAWWWLFLGYHYHTRGDMAASVAAFEKADRVSEEYGLRQTEYLSRIFRVYMYRCANQLESSEHWLDQARSALDPRRPMHVAQYHLAAQGNAVLRGKGDVAAEHARLAMDAMRGIGSRVHLVMWDLVGAIALIAGGEYKKAESWLDEAWVLTAGTYLESFRAALVMIRAASALEQGDRVKCRELMKSSLELARKGNASYYYRWVLRYRESTLAQALEAGIDVPFVTDLIRQFGFLPPDSHTAPWPWPVSIRTLGGFSIERHGEPLTFSHKVPRKPLALLKAVIAFGAVHVPEKKLIDVLWQDEEGDAAAEAYRIAVHRLRRLLGDPNCVEVQDGFLSLNFNLCWLDVNAFERVVEAGSECVEQEGSQNVSRVLQLYGGHFLPGEEEVPWTLSMREKLRSKFIAYVSRVGKRLEGAGRFDMAADCYRRGVDADDLAEELYQGLMRCLLESDRRSEGMGVYRRLRQTLSVTLGISPSPASERLFMSMGQEQARQSPIDAKR